MQLILLSVTFLNQVHAGLQPVHAWFFKIAYFANFCMRVCLCVCMSAPKAINNYWRDMV